MRGYREILKAAGAATVALILVVCAVACTVSRICGSGLCSGLELLAANSTMTSGSRYLEPGYLTKSPAKVHENSIKIIKSVQNVGIKRLAIMIKIKSCGRLSQISINL